MTVSTQVSRNEYTGNGATTQYDFTFRILDKSHLLVQTLDTSESIVTLTLGTDYTVTGVNRYNGGKVVLTSALPAGYKISIERSTPVTQEASIRNQGGFFPEIHEDALDKLTMLVQQAYGWWSGLSLRKPSWLANYYDALNNRIRNLRDPSQAQDAATKNYVDSADSGLQQQITSNFNRSLRVPDSYINQLPSAGERAWKGLGFDGAGQPKLQDPAGTGLWGYVPTIGSFEKGSLLTQRFEVLLWESTNEYWRWDGAMPKIVLPGSTPATAGGTGKGKWIDVTDATLRANLVSGDGFKYIGQVASYAALKTVIPERSGQRILLASYYANESTGGGEFVARAGTATDDGGTICVPTGSSTWYWQRVGVVDFDVTWFGAIGDSNTANSATNTTAIQNAMNAAASSGMASVTFPKSSGFYACGTIYVPAGVTLKGSNRSKSLYGATVYLRAGSNAVVSPAFKGLWTKQTYFRLWDPDNTGQMISNVWFTNCLIDGTNLSLAGKTAGDAIQIRNTTFDVHLKGTYIQNYLGAGYSAVSDNTATSYLATGVFCTLSQCKIFNCGYGIYLKGAAADSSDYHLNVVLLDHNTVNLYVDGTRSSGMGECHVYAENCRFEWATTYSIYNKDGFVSFDGWSLAPGSGGQKIFTSSKGKTSINGRLSGVAEGEDASLDGNLVAHPGIISNLTYDKASPVVPLMLNNTTRGSTLKFQALKLSFQFNGSSGFTFQNLVSYVSGNAPRFGIGGLYDNSVSAAIVDATPVSVGSGNSTISAYTQSSVISMIFGGGNKFSFVGMSTINRNTTGTALTAAVQTDATGTIIAIVLHNAATGAYVNPLSLTGNVQLSVVFFADL
ncbi:endo-N-acetylneuraminidase [Klebsiella pneumoniae]|uniref:phage tail fiber domain-containing protein n=1 Tax=Klebsiella pneumoniae TaxID=573 RepID=UPI000E2A6F18|nr:phage tail fiber protein [Klebsiella pneumoniae]SVS89250.1 endo-N-acetylneuraminidase [Klebsiella pneumoniae]